MLLHSCCSKEVWRQDLHNSVPRSQNFSPCKLRTFQACFKSRSSPEFCMLRSCNPVSRQHVISPYTSHFLKSRESVNTTVISQNQQENPRNILDLPGFKLQCHSTKTTINGRKKRRYGGILPSVFRSLDSEDDIEKALNSWKGKLSPKELTVILKEQSRWQRVVRIFRWIRSQTDYLPSVIHYNIVLRSLGLAQKWDELRLWWIEMARDGVFPSNNTYGMLVDVYGKLGLVKESLLWIKHMRIRGIYPDEVTMNTVVRVLKDAGEFDRAHRFFKNWCVGRVEIDELDLDSLGDSESESIGLKYFLSTELFKIGGRNPPLKISSPDSEFAIRKPRMTATYNTLIDLYGKANRLSDAAQVFEEMLTSGVAVDTITFNTMIFTCGSHGHLSEAEALLNKMEERGIFPDTKTYNIFLSIYSHVGKTDAALECYRKIREVGLFPDIVTHRAILQILCNRKMINEVENVMEEIEKSGLDIDEHSLPGIVKMYISEGLLQQAKVVFEKRQLNGGLMSKTYAAVMDAYADKGLWAEAEAVFFMKRDLIGQKKDISEYNVMIKAYGKAKLYDKAFSLLKGMKSHGTWPDSCTYNSLIQMFSGGDIVDQAIDLLSEMRESGFKPSCLTFSAVIASYVRLDRLSDAVDVYQEMERLEIKPNEVVYGSLINGFAESGQVEEALRYYHIMREKKGVVANQIVLTSLIKAYSKVGCLEGAEETYEKMKNMENGPDVIASNSMLNLYAELGIVSEAKLIFDQLRENGFADGISFATMIYLYKNMGMLDEAIDVAEEMRQSGLLKDSASFNKVMACYATNGQLRECALLLHEMVVTHRILPDIGTFNLMFTVLKKGGYSIEGVEQLESSYHEGKPYGRQAIMTSVFSLVGLRDFALESLETFINAEVALDPFAFNVAIFTYGELGEIHKALNIFMKMQDKKLKADVVTYIHLVGCYGKAGMVEGVKRIYSQLKYGEITPNKSLFRAIINAYRNVNRNDLVELVDQEMRFAFETQTASESETEIEEDSSNSSPDL